MTVAGEKCPQDYTLGLTIRGDDLATSVQIRGSYRGESRGQQEAPFGKPGTDSAGGRKHDCGLSA